MGMKPGADFRQTTSMKLILVAVGILAGLAGCRRDTYVMSWIRNLNYQPGEVYPIMVGEHGYPFVPVIIDGQRINLPFDTGNMTGLALGTTEINRLALPKTGEWQRLDSTGKPVGRFGIYHAGIVKVFGRQWPNQEIYEIAGRNLRGLVGPKFLLDRRYTLDYRSQMMAVSTSPLPAAPAGSSEEALVISPRHAGLILVRGHLNGQPVLIEVDTGKTRSCVDPELARRMGLTRVARGYRLDSLQIGDFDFRVAAAKPVGFGGISQGLAQAVGVSIGADILQQVIVSVDYRSGRFVLTRLSRH